MALTASAGTLYLDNLLQGASSKLWPFKQGLYGWAGPDHVFEADGDCVEKAGTGTCLRASFILSYDSLLDQRDSRAVMSGEISGGTNPEILPDRSALLWLIDSNLIFQGI